MYVRNFRDFPKNKCPEMLGYKNKSKRSERKAEKTVAEDIVLKWTARSVELASIDSAYKHLRHSYRQTAMFNFHGWR